MHSRKHHKTSSKKHETFTKKHKTVGSKSQVFKGTAQRTAGGLTKTQIARTKTASGYSYKSLKKSRKGKTNPWIKAVAQARRELKITGFVPVKKGTPLYKRAKELY